MRKNHYKAFKGLACSVSAMALTVSGAAFAQDADDCVDEDGNVVVCPETEEGPDGVFGNNPTDTDPVDITDPGATGVANNDGAIVVTGSRIKRDTYSSISPLQVLTTEVEQEAGLFDPSQILQRSESASGTQIDATFQGFVLDNGPGSQTLNLRGLGADRTLLLVNGRRLAPAGAEGAPTNPSINLLPGSLIDRYDLLLDGASSVYGSDAVAGVGNIILRKDFDGLELFARGEINPEGAGEDYTVSAAYGVNTDRGFIGFGAEYDYRDEIRLRDRDFLQGCTTNYELTTNGDIRTLGIAGNAQLRARNIERSGQDIGLVPDDCVQFVGTGALLVDNTFSFALFRQPGEGNFGLPGFSETRDAFGDDVDSDGDGIRDVDFRFNNLDGLNPDQTFLSEQKLYNVMAYGEYTFPGAANITPFFEANFSRAEISSENTGNSQLTPVVPADNQFNICNPNQPNGFDCGAVEDAFLGLPPGFVDGRFGLPTGTARETRPFFSIRGDRDNFEVRQDQYRGVLGVKGDLPFISPSWSFEVSGVYSRSEGKSSRVGVRSDRLALALGVDPTVNPELRAFGNVTLPNGPCDLTGAIDPDNVQPDLTQGCVPVNLFADSIFNFPFGSFATDAERDFLFDERNFDTTYEQTTINAFVTGDLFELPAGPVGVVLGAEYRNDKIDSQPDAVASEGLLFGFFADQGAAGSKDIKEAFAEIDIPLQAGQPWVRELNVKLAGRVTDEEFYGTNFTYSAGMGWRPIDPLLIKLNYGTSFRAPNLRENFLRGQTGFLQLFDPCAVPTEAFNPLAPEGERYDPNEDDREQTTLDNCRREGRNPLLVGINAQETSSFQSQSVEIATGGSLDIDPETSRSLTAGFAFEETFGDGYDISLGFNYYDIKIEGAIVEPSSQFIINDCFLRQDGQRSPFCDRIGVDPSAANDRMLISDIDSGFINLNEENVRGLDLNGTFGKEVAAFGRLIDLGLNVRANHLIERSDVFVDELGQATFDEDAGEFGLPKWTGRATFTADIDDLRFSWQVRYTGPVEQDAEGIDPFSDAFGRGPDGQPTGFTGDTCLGNGSGTNDTDTGEFIPDGIIEGTGVFCRDLAAADEQFLHTVSLRYRFDGFTIIAGVDNLFDTAPPLISGGEGVTQIANTAIGNGYDYDGREFFFSVRKEF
ncbi:MAG: TonB-dependent receptor [Alteripontixanthobacter sp.]